MKKPQHLSNDALVRFLDGECVPPEAANIEEHIHGCSECRRRYHDFGGVARLVDSAVQGVSPVFAASDRDTLSLLMRTDMREPARASEKTLHRVAWGMAIAASVAIVLMLAPAWKRAHVDTSSPLQLQREPASLIEVAGETFVPLPYSNPDLPVTPHIVQMQIPVSSLADAGVHFEAISNEVSGSNDFVLADVLLGIDGQPLGVHVLSGE